MPTLEIDGQKITVEEGVNLVQAAERLGIEIPHYCYHPGLSVAGNCRMCLVEVEKMPKLQIACNTRAAEGMVVRTQVERVKKAREAVLEFLLINHPVDCPICDQAGECKLQDYYMDYDRRESRVPLQSKVRKGKAKDIGKLVMLDQERCILCTRCTRFLDEVTHTGELGIFQRGDHSRIDLFQDRRLDNPYSANVVDICPVGALTNKAFRFRARVWYLDHTRSVCAACATGCNIDIHHRNGETFRFRPRHNREVNGYWMCDEGRMSFARYQGEGRLLQPVVKNESGWAAQPWNGMLDGTVERLRELNRNGGSPAVAGIVSAQATVEEAFLFRRLVEGTLKGRLAAFSWSPADASRDDFLIDADKNPNSAGLRALGLDLSSAGAVLKAVESGEVRVLIGLRADLANLVGEQRLDALARKLDLFLLLDTHYHPTAERADGLLPIGSFLETEGTFVNRKNRIQRIRQAYPPPGEGREGWQVIAELIERLGGPAAPADAAAAFAEIAASVPAFAGLSHSSIGELGCEVMGT